MNVPDKRHCERLRAAIEKLGSIRMDPDSSALRRLRNVDQALVVLDKSGEIVCGSPVERFWAIGGGWAFEADGTKLSTQLASVIRCARDEWFDDDEAADVIAIHRGKHVLLIIRQRGFNGNHLLVSVQALARRATLRDEAVRYDLTPREYEVLRLALGGFSAAEIAMRLAIAETTAQLYLKRLLQKTNSRNRAQMVATVLGSRMSHDTDVHDVIGTPPEPVVH
jgi:DNA-binding CsgD family transcriptional regulator